MAEQQRQRLEAERAQLLASLRDASDEHEQGELDEASFVAIDERDRDRLAEVEAELASLEAEAEADVEPQARSGAAGVEGPTEASWLRRHRVSVVLGAMVLILAGALSAIALGSSSSSSPTSIPALLSVANADVQQNKLAEALQLYTKVLAIDPQQPEALGETGWLTFEAGVTANSRSLITRAESEVRASVAADPKLFVSRFYLGAILLVAHDDASGALEQFKAFLALKPPSDWVKQAKPYIDKAAATAGVPVPTTVP